MSPESTPPISLSEGTRVRMPLLMLLALLGAVAAGAMAINSHREKQDEFERRLSQVEVALVDVRDMKKDVEWLRRLFEGKPRE